MRVDSYAVRVIRTIEGHQHTWALHPDEYEAFIKAEKEGEIEAWMGVREAKKLASRA